MSNSAMAVCPELGPTLAPLQVGVGVRGGAQCMGHAIRTGVLERPDDVNPTAGLQEVLQQSASG